ncbi:MULTISPECIES: helix-turn-helix domain-containing protein [unclassified Modicisalibacter]|uniref:helix-turn-helix domain-containing protein n=1 Tax=unclassified Modicisalibacter TaxID=2679913 RepID=UPI001CCC6126|nr:MULTISPECIES: helix-turn-helix domain-containing protein [unclassified Modicisalibacter]MBZ9559355.1 helix-turn-helix domain-containing protein [Modicisalibacter sp. R2A 31.J]MBZ9576480.1 helix-turn-helix domain-containing protein [Modicisalibacter sp. MOD 31.J]
MPERRQDRIPVFQLYGETGHWPTPDLLHCESIAARSRLHDWHIKPHRHADLLHLLHIRSGRVHLSLEGNERHLEGPLVIVVPAVTIHGFHFSTDIDGHIISLAKPLASHLHERLAALGEVLNRPAHYPLAEQPEAVTIDTLVGQVEREYHRPAPGREPLLHALVQALAVQIARRAERRRPRRAPSHDRGQAHLEHFLALIDDHYTEQPSIESLAARIGVTSAHLNTLCRRLAGRSALQLLHERLLLEAKRQLTYTNMTVGQIADMLGFSEPAYFTRFFKRLSGQSPKAFRLSR